MTPSNVLEYIFYTMIIHQIYWLNYQIDRFMIKSIFKKDCARKGYGP